MRSRSGASRWPSSAFFEQEAKKLLTTDLKELEVASTMVYFRQQGHEWPESVERTCKFKNLVPTLASVKKAEELARQIIA